MIIWIICIIIALTVIVLGDILYLEIAEALWNLRQRLPRWQLNYDKRRHPQRVRRDFR